MVSGSTQASRVNAARKAVADHGEERRLIRTDESIALDPNYAHALVILAVSHTFAGHLGLGGPGSRPEAASRGTPPTCSEQCSACVR
jgi:hypothetical protein